MPDGSAFYANLIIGPAGSPLDLPLPVEFSGSTPLWRARLGDGRIAVLIGRVLPLDDENRQSIENLRQVKMNIPGNNTASTDRYAEIHHVHWSETGGNIILVVAASDGMFRPEEEPPAAEARDQATRSINFQSDGDTVNLIAPDGRFIGVIEVPAIELPIEFVKGQSKFVELGQARLRIQPDNLVAGSSFIMPPRELSCNPRFDGAGFRRFCIDIHARFDGACLSAEITQTSGSLQNKNLHAPITQMDDSEELLVSIPTGGIKLSATLDAPSASADFRGRFTLRDRSKPAQVSASLGTSNPEQVYRAPK